MHGVPAVLFSECLGVRFLLVGEGGCLVEELCCCLSDLGAKFVRYGSGRSPWAGRGLGFFNFCYVPSKQ